MLQKTIDNLSNGNISDFKRGVKKMNINQRYEFLLFVKNNHEHFFDYVMYVIVKKDF